MMDERGVSPVVGTIILIAITVIVAGTIGYYATSFGTPEQKPNVTVSFDNVHDGADGFYINHTGGDSVDNADLSVKINGETEENVNLSGGDTTFSVGDRMTVNLSSNLNLNSGDRIVLTHDPSGTALASIEV